MTPPPPLSWPVMKIEAPARSPSLWTSATCSGTSISQLAVSGRSALSLSSGAGNATSSSATGLPSRPLSRWGSAARTPLRYTRLSSRSQPWPCGAPAAPVCNGGCPHSASVAALGPCPPRAPTDGASADTRWSLRQDWRRRWKGLIGASAPWRRDRPGRPHTPRIRGGFAPDVPGFDPLRLQAGRMPIGPLSQPGQDPAQHIRRGGQLDRLTVPISNPRSSRSRRRSSEYSRPALSVS